MNNLSELVERAVSEPIRSPPPIRGLVAAVGRRRRRRNVGALLGTTVAAAVVVVVMLGSRGQVDRVETAAPPPDATEPTIAQSSVAPTDVAPQLAPLDAAELLIAFQDLEAVVEIDAEPSDFFAGSASALCVNGRQVRVYEYDSVTDREIESSEITPDGQPNSLTFVAWVGPPRFFAAGTLIVLDLSGDSAVENLLTDIMGPTLSPDGRGRSGAAPTCGADLVSDAEVGDSLPSLAQPGLSPETIQEAEAVTTSFLDAMGRGDLGAAANIWTGYPFDTVGSEPELARLFDTHPWLFNDDRRLVVLPSFSWADAQPVVTVVSGDFATSFVLSVPQAGESMRIERLPDTRGVVNRVTPSSGSNINPGDTIVFNGVPVEGGSRAFVGDQELVVAVDHESLTTSVTLPDRLPATFVLTLTDATPEVPTALAIVYQSN